MTRYLALLRAINVGGSNVKMADLRTMFGSAGYAGVETFITSGNVVFDSPAGDTRTLEKEIEEHLRASLGFEVATFVRSFADLAGIARYRPFATAILDAGGSSLYIAFLPSPPSAGAERELMAYRSEIDDFRVHGSEVYWLCSKKMSESSFSGALLKRTIGMPATVRNANTVRRLVAKYQDQR